MDLNNLINKIGIKQKEENKALGTYIKNSDQNKEKLETLLSEFKEIISDEAASKLWTNSGVDEYYNYICNRINNFGIESVNILTDNLQAYKIIKDDYDKNAKFGLFLSALINKNLKAGEKVQITALMPIDYLFYRLENVEAHVNIAGTNLGSRAKNSKIDADEATDAAGSYMENCELHVKKAKDYLGKSAKNSKICAEKAGDDVGYGIEDCELHVKKAGNELGYEAKNSRIYADEAGDNAGFYTGNCELHVEIAGEYIGFEATKSKIYADEAGNHAGRKIDKSELHVKKAKDYLGESANNSRIYADEAGKHAGYNMVECELHVNKVGEYLGDSAKNSKIYAEKVGDLANGYMKNSDLSIYELEGRLDKSYLNGKNKIYLGRESYYKHYLKYKFMGVKIWKEKDLKNLLEAVPADIQDRSRLE